MNLVQKELERAETSTYHYFRILNVEVAEIESFRLPKEDLNSVTIKGIRDIHFLHSNAEGIWAKKISCRECSSSAVCQDCRAYAKFFPHKNIMASQAVEDEHVEEPHLYVPEDDDNELLVDELCSLGGSDDEVEQEDQLIFSKGTAVWAKTLDGYRPATIICGSEAPRAILEKVMSSSPNLRVIQLYSQIAEDFTITHISNLLLLGVELRVDQQHKTASNLVAYEQALNDSLFDNF